MKTLTLMSIAAAAVAGALLPAQAATNIGVSIGINAPGQYGRIDIDNYPRPALYPQPAVVIAPTPVTVYQQPIYLYVPEAHQRDWGRYCGGYRACGQPVYFVQESWVRDEYRREHDHGDRHDDHKAFKRDKHGKGHGKGHDKHGD